MPRRKPLTKGPWDDPISPLQAARFATRQTRQEIVDLVHQVCPGQGGEECKLDVDKLGEYERGVRRPGIEHVTALCKVLKRSPEDLGLIQWRDQPEAPSPDAAERPADEENQPSDFTNGTNQTIIDYPVGDTASQRLTLSGDGLAFPAGLTNQSVPAGRELEVSTAVQRSQFMRTVGTVAGAALTDPVIALARRAHDDINLTQVSNGEIDRLAEAAHHHARGYYHLGDPGRRDALLFDWAAAGHLLGLRGTHRQRRDLLDVYGRLCGILGFLSFDLGEIGRATTLLKTGQEAAREAGDGDLLGWLYDRECLIPEYAANDPRRVLALSSQGIRAVGRGTTLVNARLHARMAVAQAALGDRRAALASIDRAEGSLASAAAGCWPSERDTPRGFVFTPDLLAAEIGESRLRLGDLAEAKEACEQATALLAEAFGPDGAKESSAVTANQLNLATVMAREGELEGACEIATESLARYEGVARTFVLHRARRFERSLGSYRSSQAGREFSELLRSREQAIRTQA